MMMIKIACIWERERKLFLPFNIDNGNLHEPTKTMHYSM